MHEPISIANAYLDTWNQRAASQRQALLAQHWTADARYADRRQRRRAPARRQDRRSGRVHRSRTDALMHGLRAARQRPSVDQHVEILFPALWAAWALYWWAASFDVKPTARRESMASRLSHIAPLALAVALLV